MHAPEISRFERDKKSFVPTAVLLQDNKAAGASKEAPTNAVVQQVAKAVNGTTDTPAPDALKSAAAAPAAKPENKAVDAPAADKKSAAPAQQPLLAGAPKKSGQPASKSAGQPVSALSITSTTVVTTAITVGISAVVVYPAVLCTEDSQQHQPDPTSSSRMPW
jgi:hypothetical protein